MILREGRSYILSRKSLCDLDCRPLLMNVDLANFLLSGSYWDDSTEVGSEFGCDF